MVKSVSGRRCSCIFSNPTQQYIQPRTKRSGGESLPVRRGQSAKNTIFEILQRKTKEYTGDDTDRLGAFKAAALLQHCPPSRALAGMLAKHIVSLYDMCYADSVSFDMSTWDEKITDSLNYLFLLKAIVKEEHDNKPN